jgi:hypothetical protein
VLRFNQYDQLIQAAVAGQGIAIGRAELVDRLIREGGLALVGDGRRAVTGRGFWLITAPGAQRPEVARFAQWLRAEAAAPQCSKSAKFARAAVPIGNCGAARRPYRQGRRAGAVPRRSRRERKWTILRFASPSTAGPVPSARSGSGFPAASVR